MKKISFLALFTGVLLYSCSSTPSPDVPAETKLEENTEQSLDALNEEQLFARIELLENKLVDQESLEMSKANSIEMLESAQNHVARFPKSKNRRAVLRKGSQAAQGLNQAHEAIRLLDIAINEYSSDTTIYEEMNNQAFLYDQMGNKTRAKEIYRTLIADFPNNPYIESQKGMLKIIDMNPDELNKWLEKQHAK